MHAFLSFLFPSFIPTPKPSYSGCGLQKTFSTVKYKCVIVVLTVTKVHSFSLRKYQKSFGGTQTPIALRSMCGNVHCKTCVHSRPCIPALALFFLSLFFMSQFNDQISFFLSVFLCLSLTIKSMVVLANGCRYINTYITVAIMQLPYETI